MLAWVSMGLGATARRRWFGGIVLTTALIMLVCGQTVIQVQLKSHRLSFLSYWLVCFVLTGLAAIIALRDLRDLQQRTREQQKDLLQTALKDIETEARKRQHNASPEHLN
jgi:hypothetical protein